MARKRKTTRRKTSYKRRRMSGMGKLDAGSILSTVGGIAAGTLVAGLVAKKLLSTGFFDSTLTRSNIWASDFFSKTTDNSSKIIKNEFVEILLGKYGKECLQPISINLRTSNELDVCNALDEIAGFLVSITGQLDCNCDTDLLNIRDEMLGTINHTKYLFTLQWIIKL